MTIKICSYGAQYLPMIMRIIYFLFFLPFHSFAQIIVSGKVVEEFTGNPISYATIGLLKQNTGTNANEDGAFTINCNQPDLDTLIISSVGYSTIRVPVKELKISPVLTLSVRAVQLRPVIVKSQWSFSKVGTYKKYQDFCYTSSGSQSQVAKRITSPVANSFLQTITVQVSKHIKGKSVFRLRVYDLDSITKGPGEELTDTLIQVYAKPGTITVDMTPYHIWLPRTEFFVSIEWLLIPDNEYRFTATFEGKKKEHLNYKPCICFTKDLASSSDESWGLYYSDKWSTHNHTYSLAISAEVKY